MLTFSTPQLRDKVKKESPDAEAGKLVDSIDFLEFSDVESGIKKDVEFLKEHPLVLKDTKVTGWVYHVETGKVGISVLMAKAILTQLRPRSLKSSREMVIASTLVSPSINHPCSDMSCLNSVLPPRSGLVIITQSSCPHVLPFSVHPL
jgi:hypothetical protein